MLLKGVLTIILLAFLSTARGDDGSKADKRQFLFSALIVVNYNSSANNFGERNCSGALISDNFVITAGICVEGIQKFRIKLGDKAEGRDIEGEIEYVYDHIIYTKPLYSINHELALIKLKPRCTFTPEIQPVLIPINPPTVNNWLVVAGWNANKENDLELQWLPMRVVSDADCKDVQPAVNISSLMCARPNEDDGERRSLCGSLGSSLVAENNMLVGISIWQISSTCKDGIQTFARVRWFNFWISAAFEIAHE